MICVLSGGTGGAKFVQGIAAVMPARELTVIVNTGDDLTWWGLHVSPDLDSITYALAGMLSRERGWGVEGDTFHCLEAMRRIGSPAWFQVGDRDLATHVWRTELLSQGKTLSEVTSEIAQRLGIEAQILPMTNQCVETRVSVLACGGGKCENTWLSFQEYFVREHYRLPVREVRFAGAEWADPAPGVLEAIAQAEAVVIAPSNPVTSIGPILAVPGIRKELKRTKAPVAAISPIIAGAAVSGPAGELLKTKGLPVSIAGVARCYRDFLDLLIANECDWAFGAQVEGVATRYTRTLMESDADKTALARAVLGFVRERPDVAAAS